MKIPKSHINWPFRVPSRIRSHAIYILQKSRRGVVSLRDKASSAWRKKRAKKGPHAR